MIGYSEGGTCAVTLALRHPEQFTVFVDIAGDPRPNLGTGAARDRIAVHRFYGDDEKDTDAHDPLKLLQTRRFDGLSGWFVAGQHDPPARRAAELLAPAAAAAGVDTRFSEPPGHHSFDLVNAVSADCFDWVSERLGAGAPTTPT